MNTGEHARALAVKCDRQSATTVPGLLLALDIGAQQRCWITQGVYRHPNDGCQVFCFAEPQDSFGRMLESRGKDFMDRFESEVYGFGEIEIGKIHKVCGLRCVFVID